MDNHPKPPHATTGRHAPETNFNSLLLQCAIASTSDKSLTPPQKVFIQNSIQELFPTVGTTPDHPTYAWMIEDAIKQLDQEEGSSEEAISKFILEQQKDLPWAHAALLKHHLRKLSETGVLVESLDGCYLIGKAKSITLDYISKPSPNSPCETSHGLSLSSSPSSSSISSPTYESTSTSSSIESFRQKRKRDTRRNNNKTKTRGRGKQRKKRDRGIKIRPKYKQGRGCSGKGRGQGQLEDEAEEELYLMEEDEPADEENIQEQPHAGNLNSVDVGHQAQESAMEVEIEIPGHECGVNKEKNERLQQEMGKPYLRSVEHQEEQSSFSKMLEEISLPFFL